MKDCLNVIAEPAYANSIWFDQGMAGIRESASKQHISVSVLWSPEELPAATECFAVIVVASQREWIHYVINELRRRGIKPILVGAVPGDFGDDVSGLVFNRYSLVESTVHYLYGCGKRHLASISTTPQSSNDLVRCQAFFDTTRLLGIPAEKHDVYYTEPDMRQGIHSFINNACRYDGVICTNDYIAVELLAAATTLGIHIPDELFVVGSGDFIISSHTQPTLTTSTLGYRRMGSQAVNMWSLFHRDPSICAMTITLPCELICRESTQSRPMDFYYERNVIVPSQSVFSDNYALKLRRLENCLQQCDKMDYQILRLLLMKKSYEEISSEIYASLGTVQYRMKKMLQLLNCTSRGELIQLLNTYIPSIGQNL